MFPVTDPFACISEVPSGLTVTLQADSDAGMSVASQTGLPAQQDFLLQGTSHTLTEMASRFLVEPVSPADW